MANNANWYVPAVSGNIEFPEDVFITMFDSKNHVGSNLSSQEIKKEFERNSKAVGEYILSLSPERLALHETIISMSTMLKMDSEDHFIETFNQIYNEAVLPSIEQKSSVFQLKQKMIKKEVEEEASKFFNQDLKGENSSEDFTKYNEKYNKNLAKYEAEVSSLEAKFEKERPSRADRARMNDLLDVTNFMKNNKERIIVDLVVNARTLGENKKIVNDLVSGENGVFNSSYMDKFNKLTQYNSQDRKSYLIVGGAASGKGGITEKVKNTQTDPNDLLEINPDLYKKLLLPHEDVKDHIELHAGLTHAESSIVFDGIADRWQKMAESNSAPNILMDVQRAGSWQLGVLGSGGTNVTVSSPVLPTEVALERCQMRGEKTGRFVPTPEVIQGHKDQLNLNFNAMKKGVSYKFYNTNIEFGEEPPLIAEFDSKAKNLEINDMQSMYDYFKKDKLNTGAKNLETLSTSTNKTTAKSIINHAEIMNIDVKSNYQELASIKRDNETGDIVFHVKNWNELSKNMGLDNAKNLLHGMYENKAKIRGNKEVANILMKLNDKANEKQENDIVKPSVENIECEEYATLLKKLTSEGRRVGKTESVYTYDFANDAELRDKQVTIRTDNLDILSDEGDLSSSNVYDPEKPAKKQMLLVIDPKVHNSEAKREELLVKIRAEIKETGQYTGEGVYMNQRGKLGDDYITTENSSGINKAEPNPDAVRISYKINDNSVRIPVQWDANGYTIEQDGSIVVREKDIQELETSLNKYDKDKDASHLFTDDGRAKLDVYGTDPFFVEDNYSQIFTKSEFNDGVKNIIDNGIRLESKNATCFDDVIAYQLKDKEYMTMPDGVSVESGDWVAMSVDKFDDISKGYDLNGEFDCDNNNVFHIDNETMKKSYLNSNINNYALQKEM